MLGLEMKDLLCNRSVSFQNVVGLGLVKFMEPET